MAIRIRKLHRHLMGEVEGVDLELGRLHEGRVATVVQALSLEVEPQLVELGLRDLELLVGRVVHALQLQLLGRQGVDCRVVRDLGLRQLRILTNNPRKFRALQGYNLSITERVPLEIEANPDNRRYLQTKRDKLGHLLKPDEES